MFYDNFGRDGGRQSTVGDGGDSNDNLMSASRSSNVIGGCGAASSVDKTMIKPQLPMNPKRTLMAKACTGKNIYKYSPSLYPQSKLLTIINLYDSTRKSSEQYAARCDNADTIRSGPDRTKYDTENDKGLCLCYVSDLIIFSHCPRFSVHANEQRSEYSVAVASATTKTISNYGPGKRAMSYQTLNANSIRIDNHHHHHHNHQRDRSVDLG